MGSRSPGRGARSSNASSPAFRPAEDRPGNGAAMAAKFGDQLARLIAHRDVVDAAAPAKVHLARMRRQCVADLRRRDEADRALRGHHALIAAVAGEGEGGIGEGEHEAAVAHAVAIRHVGPHRHLEARLAGRRWRRCACRARARRGRSPTSRPRRPRRALRIGRRSRPATHASCAAPESCVGGRARRARDRRHHGRAGQRGEAGPELFAAASTARGTRR